jgi:hypothetical protein
MYDYHNKEGTPMSQKKENLSNGFIPGAKKFMAVSVIAASAFMATGCSPASSPDNNSSASQSATQEASAEVPNTGEVMDNGKGKYLQSTVADNDPALKYDESLSDEKIKKLFTADELAAAQKTAVKFLAEETIDSTMQGGGNADKWLDANKDKLAPSWLSEASIKVKEPKSGFLVNNPGRAKAGYDLAYDEKEVRVVDRKIEVRSISESKGRPFVEGTVSYGIKTNDGGKETASGKFAYALTKDGDKWLISGYRNQISITPFTMPLNSK